MGDVVSLSNKANDSFMADVDTVLKDCLEMRAGSGMLSRSKKMVVIWVDETEGKYDVGFCQSQMYQTELIALVEIFKATLFKDMGVV